MTACVTFRDLTLGDNRHPAVHHLSGIVARGSLTAVVGTKGSGKSTLIKGIVGILEPLFGSCSVAPGVRLACLPQQSELDRSFPARAIDLVAIGVGLLASVSGLLSSCHASMPSGPAIILSAGAVCFGSVLLAPHGVLLSRLPRTAHRTA